MPWREAVVREDGRNWGKCGEEGIERVVQRDREGLDEMLYSRSDSTSRRGMDRVGALPALRTRLCILHVEFRMLSREGTDGTTSLRIQTSLYLRNAEALWVLLHLQCFLRHVFQKRSVETNQFILTITQIYSFDEEFRRQHPESMKSTQHWIATRLGQVTVDQLLTLSCSF